MNFDDRLQQSCSDEFCQPNSGITSNARHRPDDFCQPNAAMGRKAFPSVGTRGGVGWMRGPCACPGGSATMMPHGTQANRVATRTSTRPPPIPTSAPCPYRTGPRALLHSVGKVHQDGASTYCCIRLSNIIRTGPRALLYSVVKIQQDGGALMEPGRIALPPGQAQGPLIHPTPPLVPTEGNAFLPITPFGWQSSSGRRGRKRPDGTITPFGCQKSSGRRLTFPVIPRFDLQSSLTE